MLYNWKNSYLNIFPKCNHQNILPSSYHIESPIWKSKFSGEQAFNSLEFNFHYQDNTCVGTFQKFWSINIDMNLNYKLLKMIIWSGGGDTTKTFSSWTHHMKIEGTSSCKLIYLAHKNEIHHVEIPCLDKERWEERRGEERRVAKYINFIFLHCKVTQMLGEFWIYDLTLHPRGRGRAIRAKTPLEEK